MDNIQWIFSGIGTSVLSFIIGGFIGYKFGISKNKQAQFGGKNTKQVQKNAISSSIGFNNQSQTAGDGSIQYQENNNNGNK